jgi:hypothetical protein
MIVTKRFSRDGFVISALCHAGVLAVVLLFVRATPQEAAVPPDAVQVEFVTPKDIPRYSGTPSTLRTSGTEQAARSQGSNAKGEQSSTIPSPPQPKNQHQAQRDAPPKPQELQEPQPTPPQAKEPRLPTADAAQVANAQPVPDPPAPSAVETPDTAVEAAKAFFALAGGRLGGGFAAPPIDSPLVGYDFTEPFRELLSTCGALPPGLSRNQKISITVRVFLDRDGTVAAAPQLLDSNPSSEQQTLMQNFVSGLQKCQPYAMLPKDRYNQWKTLDLVVHPHNYAQ